MAKGKEVAMETILALCRRGGGWSLVEPAGSVDGAIFVMRDRNEMPLSFDDGCGP